MGNKIYSVGLRNAGSYVVSGQPFVDRRSVNAGDEVKISFPYVPKKITIRIPSPPNNARLCKTKTGSGGHIWLSNVAPNSKPQPGTGEPNLNLGGAGHDFAYSFWMRTNDVGTGNAIAYFYSSSMGGVTANGFNIWNTTAGGDGMSLYNGNVFGASPGLKNYFVHPLDGNWHHCVLTQCTGTIGLYMDKKGVEKAGNMDIINVLRFGWNGSGTSDEMEWDECTVFGTGFTHHDVAELYNSGEWMDPRKHSKGEFIQSWVTMGDAIGDYPMPIGPIAGSSLNNTTIVKDVVSTNDYTVQSFNDGGGYNDHDFVSGTLGPFTSQTTGKLRTTMVRSLIGGIDLPSSQGELGNTDNYLSVPQYGGTDYNVGAGGAAQTVSFWFKSPRNSFATTYDSFIMANSALGGRNIAIRRTTGPLGDGSGSRLKIKFGGATFYSPFSPDGLVLLDNNWHNIIFVADGPNSKVRIYVDGDYWKSGDKTMTVAAQITDWNFGKPVGYGGALNNYGAISIWNAAFDDAQALELYNIGGLASPTSHSLSSDLKNYYNFDPATGDTTTTIQDRVGSNDATIIVHSGKSRTAKFIEGPGRNVVGGKHYYELQGYGTSIELPMKSKDLYFQALGAQVTFEVVAELTNIPPDKMYELAGSGIDE